MRGSYQRIRSYRKKIRGLVHPWQPLLKNATVQKEVEIERMVESIVGPSLLRGHYMVFAKEVSKLMKKYKGQMLYTEVCIKYDKWVARGLNTVFLDLILGRMNLPLCAPPVILCEDWDNQIDCENAGCYWWGGSCHDTPEPPPHVETRYLRSDQQTVNGLTAYKLSTTQSSSLSSVTINTYIGLSEVYVTQYLGIRVWKRDSNQVETEITSGTAVAIASSDVNGLINAIWACIQTVLTSSDSIVVRVYADDFSPPTTLRRTFTTEQLGASQLDSVTWTVYYYLGRTSSYNSKTGLWRVTYTFRHGSTTYNSRIENFQWRE